jgi:hypothetical protein
MIKINKLLLEICCKVNLKLYYVLAYFHNRGKFPKLKKPTNVSELIISNIVSGKINQYAWLADKYKVREFVKERGLSDILTALYGHWTNANDIDFDNLPNQFVLKCNFGCGMNIVCKDKSKLDFQQAKAQLNEWMQYPQNWASAEPHYSKIERCIIAEELIQDAYFDLPMDYKFLCMNGKPHSIFVCTERDKKDFHVKFHSYSLDWVKLDLMKYDYKEDIPKPANLDKMIEYAKTLSLGFDFVRVDLYDTGDKVFFGEMTFTPQGGLLRYYTTEVLEEMWNDKNIY